MNGDQLAKSPYLARALVFAGGIIHSVGSHLLKQQNEDLGDQLSHARGETYLLIHRAYALGRKHQATADPGPHPADLVDTVRALGDDEHQDDEPVAADVSPGTGATDSVPRAGGDASRGSAVTARDAG